MVDRLLSMLNQYLVSNKTLELDKSFKVYLKVLSAEHSAINKMRTPKKRKKGFGRLHVGAYSQEFKAPWALDVPQWSEKLQDKFKNKCLLLCTILGISQHEFFRDKKKDYLYMAYAQSKSIKKQNYALSVLNENLDKLLNATDLPKDGPYNLNETLKVLSSKLNCQFYIFEGIIKSGSKLIIRYPEDFDSSLQPIFLYKPYNSAHIIFIKNIQAYFKVNGKICLVCKRSFKSKSYRHFCKEISSCFACHRFFMTSTTFYHAKLNYYCNSKMTSELTTTCKICNVNLASKSCAVAHKRLCNSKGFFGYKCLKCQKFTYKYNNYSSEQLKALHVCNKTLLCRYCHQLKSENHLCLLRQESLPLYHCRLGFLCISFEYISISNMFSTTNAISANLYLEDEEVNRGTFTEYVINEFDLGMADTKDSSCFHFNYFPSKNVKMNFKTVPKSQIDQKFQNLNSCSFDGKLIKLLLSTKFLTTFVVLDEDGFQMLYLLKLFCNNGICPEVIKRNGTIILLELKDYGVRILPSSNYIPGDVYAIADQFNLQYNRYYFPYKLLQKENFNYVAKVPEIDFFCDILQNPKDANLVEFLEKFHVQIYNFRKEFLTHIKQKSFLFTYAMLKFLNEFFVFQLSFDTVVTNYLNPFNSKNVTLGGAVYRLFKILFLKKKPIYVVLNEFGKHGKFVSRIEHEYVSYLEHKSPEKKFITAFNNPNGQKYFKEAYADAYSELTGECIMVLGCHFHCHNDPSCAINKGLTDKTNKQLGKSFEECNKERETQMFNLIANNAEIQSVNEIWECQIKKLRNDDVQFQNFLTHIYVKIPLERLTPRSCYRGSYTDNYQLKWTSNKRPNESLYFCDINGLYGFVSISKKFMIDKYKVLIGQDLNDLKIINNQFYLIDKRVSGAIMLSILPPKTLLFPFLQYRKKSGQNCNTLCRLCCESRSKKCKHSDSNRAIIGSYMMSEIEYALTLGYEIVHIFECHVYEQHDFIFREFVEKLNYFKTKYTDCFQGLQTIKSKLQCLTDLNRKMNLSDSTKFTLKSIEPNKGKRQFYKLAQNSFFGKFGQKNNMGKIVFISDQSQLDKLVNDGENFSDVTVINENVCCVNIKPKKVLKMPNLNSNVYLSAQITAFARETIHKHIMRLHADENISIFQVDCDSIIFSAPSSAKIPLEISPAIGDFKFEIEGKILSYFSLGPKNYTLTYLNKDNEFKSIHKISGLKLTSDQKIDLANSNVYEMLLDKLKHNFYDSTSLLNKKRKLDIETLTFLDYTQSFTISNQIQIQRNLVIKDDLFLTYPFGYSNN